VSPSESGEKRDQHARGRPEADPLAGSVERAFPQLVHTDDQGAKRLTSYPLIGALIEAVKELDSRLSRLEAQDWDVESKAGSPK
jgi:hypothetical protein